MLSLVVLCALLSVVRGQTTVVEQCLPNSNGVIPPSPVNQYIEGCTETPCLLPQERDAVITAVFKADRLIKSMQTKALAYFISPTIPLDYPLQEFSVTCNYLLNSYCPLVEGEVVQYQLNFFIQSFFPVGTSLPVEFKVLDEHENDVFCIRVQITIVPPVFSRHANTTTNA